MLRCLLGEPVIPFEGSSSEWDIYPINQDVSSWIASPEDKNMILAYSDYEMASANLRAAERRIYLKDQQAYAIVGYKGPKEGSNLIVPNIVNGKRIVAIGSDVFASSSPDDVVYYDTITISEGIIALANDVFNHNFCVKSIYLPETLFYIGTRCISGCMSLREITIPKSVEFIRSDAFSQNHSLKSIICHANIRTIPKGAFSFCPSLREFSLPKTVETIGAYAFSGSGLERIRITNPVKRIGEKAFSHCGKLRGVIIGRSVEQIAPDAFDPMSKNPDLTIHTFTGTYAYRFAKTYGYHVRLIDRENMSTTRSNADAMYYDVLRQLPAPDRIKDNF